MSLIKVFANSRVSAVVGGIVGVIRGHERAEVYAIGEEAINQALKAVDRTIVYFRQDKIDIHCMMASGDETTDKDTRPVIRLIVEPQRSLDLLIEATGLAA